MSPQELKEKLQQARNELSIERGATASATKTAGKTRQLRILIARILTILRERNASKEVKHK